MVELEPALKKAAAVKGKEARVVSVLAGGKEGMIWKEDLLLKEQGHYGVGIAGGAASSMTGLFFEEVVKQGWGKMGCGVCTCFSGGGEDWVWRLEGWAGLGIG